MQTNSESSSNSSKDGRDIRVGCLVQDEDGDVGRVTYVEGNVVVYRLSDPSAKRFGQPIAAAFTWSELTVIEEPPTVAGRELPDYHPHVAEWDVGMLDDTTGIYHSLPGSNHFDKGRPLVATVAVNPDLKADARRVLQMMALAPALWRELREVAADYVWISDSLHTPDTMEDFARITNLLIEAAGVFPWDAVEAHGDEKINAANTDRAAAAAVGAREAVQP